MNTTNLPVAVVGAARAVMDRRSDSVAGWWRNIRNRYPQEVCLEG